MYKTENKAFNATPVRHSAIPVQRSPCLLHVAQRYNSESSLLVGLLNEQGVATITVAAGSKQSYHKSGESAPSLRSRTQPLDSHFIYSLMLSIAGEHAFPELTSSRCSSSFEPHSLYCLMSPACSHMQSDATPMSLPAVSNLHCSPGCLSYASNSLSLALSG